MTVRQQALGLIIILVGLVLGVGVAACLDGTSAQPRRFVTREYSDGEFRVRMVLDTQTGECHMWYGHGLSQATPAACEP